MPIPKKSRGKVIKNSPVNREASPFGENTMNMHIWGYYDKLGSRRGYSQYGVNISNIAGVTPLHNSEGPEQVQHLEISGDKVSLHIKGKEFWVTVGETGHRYLTLDDPGYRTGDGMKVYHYTNKAGKWTKKLIYYK